MRTCFRCKRRGTCRSEGAFGFLWFVSVSVDVHVNVYVDVDVDVYVNADADERSDPADKMRNAPPQLSLRAGRSAGNGSDQLAAVSGSAAAVAVASEGPAVAASGALVGATLSTGGAASMNSMIVMCAPSPRRGPSFVVRV